MIKCVWGHDVAAPRVELPRPLPPRALGYVRRGVRFALGYVHDRHTEAPELLRYYTGRFVNVRTTEIKRRAWKRFESAELDARMMQFFLIHHDAHTGDVGLLTAGGELRPFTWGELLDRLQCSEMQLKRRFKNWRASGFIWRDQQRDEDDPTRAKVATIKLCAPFFAACKVAELRARWLKKRAIRAAAERAGESARDRERRWRVRDAIRSELLAGRDWDSLLGRHKLAMEAEIDRVLAERRGRPPPT